MTAPDKAPLLDYPLPGLGRIYHFLSEHLRVALQRIHNNKKSYVTAQTHVFIETGFQAGILVVAFVNPLR